jgi:TolB-like protein/Flp pilus assembly protein TadD
MRVGFGIVVLGFFATLVLAWYHGERGQQKVGGTELLILSLLLAIGGGLLWSLERDAAPAAALAPARAPAAIAVADKSIAVLPFANLSSDKDNAYFADGIQDEILTRLANIGELKVVSRTSTLRFASTPDNLSEIARQLGVAHIVEGSVQKVGDRVRINVQLIRADTDTHLWAQIYDRKLDDIFGIQSEVAGAIAQALQARLTRDEVQAVARKPTENPAAYDAYLRGLSFEARGLYGLDIQQAARDQYLEATRLDPGFVDAWTHLASVQSFLYFNGVERNRDGLERLRRSADTVARLRPDSGEAWMALGYYRYRGLHDFPGAVAAFEQAAQRLPNSAAALSMLAFVERRLGRMDAALEHLRQAETLDPASPNYAATAGEILLALRRFAPARTALERALARAPGDLDVLALLAASHQAEGDLDAADRVLASSRTEGPSDVQAVWAKITQLELRRDHDGLIARVQALVAADHDPGWEYRQAWYRLALAGAWERKGDAGRARAEYEAAVRQLELARAAGEDESDLLSTVARAQAGLGHEAAALLAANQSIATLHRDAKEEPALLAVKAAVLARFGDHDAALVLLERLLVLPYGLTPAHLRLEPAWDPLRADPRFRVLSGEAAPAS